ncbi:unnamed protein product, partial [Rotaria sp. Silwood1]
TSKTFRKECKHLIVQLWQKYIRRQAQVNPISMKANDEART